MYQGEAYGEWIEIVNEPEREDTYLVAWLARGEKRDECWVGFAEYHDGEWDVEDLEKQQSAYWGKDVKVDLYAWMPLPEMYRPSPSEFM